MVEADAIEFLHIRCEEGCAIHGRIKPGGDTGLVASKHPFLPGLVGCVPQPSLVIFAPHVARSTAWQSSAIAAHVAQLS